MELDLLQLFWDFLRSILPDGQIEDTIINFLMDLFDAAG